MKHVAFFGDGERTFALPFPLIEELQRKTGVGIGALFQRMRSLHFSIADISETIRLALIGGGNDPKEAAALVATYVQTRPLADSIPLAFAILETVWLGSPTTSQDDQRHEAAHG
ncbi:gene transfer agent family protein [Mesorhizobium sp. YIM 152430]|uniref:gene transfer agent family protein n=1 Tax=Mesorhizobium sp. YIM 152430 TaxID=3031761 RepID=UPI0023DC5255|nr:gene transfer agent family protein [Mesorhizobium sp. YIM 152430]MDF1598253.1 gene transfer agent family protein [Mesorhizobium sp. YIM 152430]